MTSFVIPYFRKLNLVFNSSTNSKNYKVGIYAPRYICSYISELGLAEYSFVADMSSGFSCNLGYPIPKNWAFYQFFEMNTNNGGIFPSSPSFDLDKDGYSGRDKGISAFDKATYLTPDQLAEKNSDIMADTQRDQFIYNVFEPLGYLGKVYNSSLSYGKEFSLDTIVLDGLTIKVTSKITNTYTTDFSNTPITIELDNEGKLTASCEAEIEGLIAGVEIGDFEGIDIIDSTIDDLKEVAASVTAGQIGIKVNLNGINPKLTFVITADDIFPDSGSINQEITIEICFELIPTPKPDLNSEYEFEINTDTLIKAGVSVATVITLIALSTTPAGQALVLKFLISIGILSPAVLAG